MDSVKYIVPKKLVFVHIFLLKVNQQLRRFTLQMALCEPVLKHNETPILNCKVKNHWLKTKLIFHSPHHMFFFLFYVFSRRIYHIFWLLFQRQMLSY